MGRGSARPGAGKVGQDRLQMVGDDLLCMYSTLFCRWSGGVQNFIFYIYCQQNFFQVILTGSFHVHKKEK